MIRRVARTAFLAIAAFSLSACGGGSGGTTAPETGNVSVVFTDGPTDQYDRILVSMTEMTLIGPGGQVELLNVGGGEPVTFDLLAMREWGDLAFNTDVLTGQYNKIRIQLTEIALEDTSETNPAPTEYIRGQDLPADGTLDLNPRGPFEVTADQTTVIKLDIDAEKSFLAVATGNGRIRFRPIVFVEVFQDEIFLPDRLVRVFGKVDEISPDGEPESFRVCDLEFISQAAGPNPGDPEECVRVYAEGPVGIFDEQGVATDFDTVADDDTVTAIGFLAATEDAGAVLGLYSVAVALGDRGSETIDGWETVKGAVTSDCASEGCTFGFDTESGSSVVVSMAATTPEHQATGVYQANGVELTQQAITSGDIGSIDAWETATDQYAAALVVLSTDVGGNVVVSGTLDDVKEGTLSDDYHILTVTTDSGDPVVFCADTDTDILRVLADTVTAEVFVVDPDALATGASIEAFGEDDASDPACAFLADQVVVGPAT